MGYIEDQHIKATLELLRLESYRAMGRRAREVGASSSENPFLVKGAVADTAGHGEHDWMFRCNAWWQGWDAEDRRRLEIRERRARAVSEAPRQSP
jgi:hypothetical protein